jgi:DNA-binding MarR family transcriptional regulator
LFLHLCNFTAITAIITTQFLDNEAYMPRSVQQLASRLTFRQLQVFLAAYEQQSYSKAGELLGLTQPAVSSQIRQL